MDYTEVKNYFIALATANNWEFAHNYEHLEEKIGHELFGKTKFILCMDEPEGVLTYNGNYYNQDSQAFWLLKSNPKGNWINEDVIFTDAQVAAKIIFNAMHTDTLNHSGVFANWRPELTNYRKVGPLTKERLFGIRVSIVNLNPLNFV